MPVTVRGGDILFNDGTTQSTAAVSLGSYTAGDIYPAFVVNVGGSSTSYTISPTKFIMNSSGTVKVRTAYSCADPYGSNLTAYTRVFINGSAVGSEYSSYTPTVYYAEQTFSVNKGDVIQVGTRGAYNGYQQSGRIQVGTNSNLTTNSLFIVGPGSSFM